MVPDAAVRARQDLMVEAQLVGRGISDEAVLTAIREMPRDLFADPALSHAAADDVALVDAEGDVVPQPYLAALVLEQLHLDPNASVLEIGTGSGYLTALIGRLAGKVRSIAPDQRSAERVARRLAALELQNVEIVAGNFVEELAKEEKFEAILVTEQAAPTVDQVPVPRDCLVILVRPTGESEREVIRFAPRSGDEPKAEPVARIHFVTLAAGRNLPIGRFALMRRRVTRSIGDLAQLVKEAAEPLDRIEGADLGALLDRIPDSTRLVLIGEASHGTSEFYRMRAQVTQELIAHRGFQFVGAEADWPDAAHFDRYARALPVVGVSTPPFTRFPTWMWRNREVADFVSWLREWNKEISDPTGRVGFHGLDLYSLHASLVAVLDYLDRVDPTTANLARQRYGCLRSGDISPAEYGKYALTGRYRSCEAPVVNVLTDLLRKRLELASDDRQHFFDAELNARLVANAERYYRIMYYGSIESWNLRDRHMFETLQRLLDHYGPSSRGVVWAHNSHLGDASKTEMGDQGELNVGQLTRAAFGEDAYLIGFGTDRGTVAAASDWGYPMQRMTVRPAHPSSYEAVCREADIPAFALHLRAPRRAELTSLLSEPRLERAIGVVYRPETELQSHYFGAVLSEQFDEYLWITETSAVEPLPHVSG